MTITHNDELTTVPPPAPGPLLPADGPGPSPSRRSGLPARFRAAGSSLAWAGLGAGVLVAIWALVATRAPNLPTPSEGLAAARELFADPFYDNGPNDKGIALLLLLSVQRVFIGFAMAAVVAIPLGLLIGGSRRAWQAANPLVQLLRPVSPLAWFPIGLAALSDVPHALVFMIFVISLWPMVINTAAGAASVPRDHRNVAKVFHFGRMAYLRHVMLPHSLPAVVTGMRLSMGYAWMVIVAGEMLAGSSGIGGFVWQSYNAGDVVKVVAAIVPIGIVGLVIDIAFLRLGSKVALEEVHA